MNKVYWYRFLVIVWTPVIVIGSILHAIWVLARDIFPREVRNQWLHRRTLYKQFVKLYWNKT